MVQFFWDAKATMYAYTIYACGLGTKIHGFSSALLARVHYRKRKKIPGTRNAHLDHHTKSHHPLRTPACENGALLTQICPIVHRWGLQRDATRRGERRFENRQGMLLTARMLTTFLGGFQIKNRTRLWWLENFPSDKLPVEQTSHNGMHKLIDKYA